MDTIGDFITIIRNALAAKRESCDAQWSKVRASIATILKNEGYIKGFKVEEDERGFKRIILSLKYVDGGATISSIQRFSKPGRRQYFEYRKMPRVLDGLGISIVSTSQGVLACKDARKQKVGGELLCTVW